MRARFGRQLPESWQNSLTQRLPSMRNSWITLSMSAVVNNPERDGAELPVVLTLCDALRGRPSIRLRARQDSLQLPRPLPAPRECRGGEWRNGTARSL